MGKEHENMTVASEIIAEQRKILEEELELLKQFQDATDLLMGRIMDRKLELKRYLEEEQQEGGGNV